MKTSAARPFHVKQFNRERFWQLSANALLLIWGAMALVLIGVLLGTWLSERRAVDDRCWVACQARDSPDKSALVLGADRRSLVRCECEP